MCLCLCVCGRDVGSSARTSLFLKWDAVSGAVRSHDIITRRMTSICFQTKDLAGGITSICRLSDNYSLYFHFKLLPEGYV